MTKYKLLSPKSFIDLLSKETTRRVIPVDSTWYLPNAHRDGKQEFLNVERIPNAVFFDIDTIKDTKSPYPHMLPDVNTFNAAMSKLGLKREDILVVYDRIGNFSGPRCAWTLTLFGHPSVCLLNNFKLYKAAGYPLETTPRGDAGNGLSALDSVPSAYEAVWDSEQERFFKDQVVSYEEMLRLVETGALKDEYNAFDARSIGRFQGKDPEPREGLTSGHIPGVQPLPFTEVLDPVTMEFPETSEAMKQKLEATFAKLGDTFDPEKRTLVMCGTGVTAAVIRTALEHAGVKNLRLYDGSWTEWAQRADPQYIVKDGE